MDEADWARLAAVQDKIDAQLQAKSEGGGIPLALWLILMAVAAGGVIGGLCANWSARVAEEWANGRA